jgi:hypothetical protein
MLESIKKGVEISDELKPYEDRINEIRRLCDLLEKNNICIGMLDIGTFFAFEAMCKRNETEEAFEYLRVYLQKKVSDNKLE